MNSSYPFFTAPSPSVDFGERPFIVIWEVTQACDLACVHCRASAQPRPSPGELTTSQGLELIREIADWKVPLFVMSGGDPLKRPDLLRLVAECSDRRMSFALSLSVTPLLTRERLLQWKEAGVHRVSISLDGADAKTHDAFRGVPGTFHRSLEILAQLRELGMGVQVNTSVGRHNFRQLDRMAELLIPFNIEMWSVFFLVPTGRALKNQLLNAGEVEEVLVFLAKTLEKGWFKVKTTEAPHFRRVVLQLREKSASTAGNAHPLFTTGLSGVSRGVNDGRGFVFISHRGGVFPSGFLPSEAGNVKEKPLKDIYQNSGLFRKLRNAGELKGKCGRCEYNPVCGGSRARAYAMTGDPLASDPLCAYQPAASRRKPASRETPV